MNTMNIHNITLVELANETELGKRNGSKLGYVRHLEITDDSGRTLRFNLFSDVKGALNFKVLDGRN